MSFSFFLFLYINIPIFLKPESNMVYLFSKSDKSLLNKFFDFGIFISALSSISSYFFFDKENSYLRNSEFRSYFKGEKFNSGYISNN